MKLEDRVSLLEAAVAEWESRRRKLIPPELEKNENVQAVIKDCLKGYHEKMRDFAGQRKMDEATTEMNRLRAEAAAELERKQKAELAELLAAIQFYEDYGYSPPGYDISVKTED
jgi:hypothetical protein